MFISIFLYILSVVNIDVSVAQYIIFIKLKLDNSSCLIQHQSSTVSPIRCHLNVTPHAHSHLPAHHQTHHFSPPLSHYLSIYILYLCNLSRNEVK